MFNVSAFVSEDPDQDGFTPLPIGITVGENDVAGVQLSDFFGNVTTGFVGLENNESDFQVRLLSQPSSSVTVEFTPHDSRMSGTAVTFTPSDWNVQHLVALPIMNDTVHEGDVSVMVTVVSHSQDPIYAEKTQHEASVFVIDDD